MEFSYSHIRTSNHKSGAFTCFILGSVFMFLNKSAIIAFSSDESFQLYRQYQ